MKNKEYRVLLIVLVLLLFLVNYGFIDNFLKKTFFGEEFVVVERVIDGDTLVIDGNSMRLLGINTPEKGEFLYEEAKDFLEELTFNKTLLVEKHGKDLYGRELVYLFDKKKNLNIEIVKEGFANYYFPEGKDTRYNKFKRAWETCLRNNKNLCELSKEGCSGCIELKEFKKQLVILYNKCGFDCNLSGWSIKDQGRKKFVFEDFVLGSEKSTEITAEDFNEEYVWTETGDTLFLRDSKGKLVLWKKYGY